MNRKDKAVWDLLWVIYTGKPKPKFNQSQVDEINDAYKNKFQDCDDLNDFLTAERSIASLIKNEQTMLDEIESKIQIRKALQPGVIMECNLSASLAELIGLYDRYSFRNNVSVKSIPLEIKNAALGYNVDLKKCRYAYYQKGNRNVLLQYGDPNSCDALLIYQGFLINIEYKERMAKAGEYDLTHDDSGKLFVPKSLKDKMPLVAETVAPMVESFNKNTNLFDILGTNYKEFDNLTKMRALIGYFNSKKIDMLVSTDKNDNIVAIIPAWIDTSFTEGDLAIVSADGSEIRSTGRNPSKIISTSHFKKVLSEAKAIKSGTVYSIDERNKLLKIAKSRGSTRASKIKIKNLYEVSLKNKGRGHAYKHNGRWYFDESTVAQKKPTVSPHITIVATRDEIIRRYFTPVEVS